MCRNQLDCLWVVDDKGETICVASSNQSIGVGVSSCQCVDETRINEITGRCLDKAKHVAWFGMCQYTICVSI